jgi:hypothetical protein
VSQRQPRRPIASRNDAGIAVQQKYSWRTLGYTKAKQHLPRIIWPHRAECYMAGGQPTTDRDALEEW